MLDEKTPRGLWEAIIANTVLACFFTCTVSEQVGRLVLCGGRVLAHPAAASSASCLPKNACRKSDYTDLLFDVSHVLPENSFWEAV